jgi:hypothetical protein
MLYNSRFTQDLYRSSMIRSCMERVAVGRKELLSPTLKERMIPRVESLELTLS